MKVIAKFDVKYLQIMDDNGNAKGMPKISNDVIKKMYKDMVLARVFDEKMLSLQRQGRIGTFAQSKGQEGCQIPVVYALGKDDWVFPAFREHPLAIARGMPMEMILQFYGGDERGHKMKEGVNVFSVAIPVGTQPLHAVGFAWASKIQGKRTAVLTYFGDGGTSEGDFHEAMNFAGVFKAPIVFMCQNNQFAISVPRKKQTVAETLAQKSIAYGFEGMQVDGNDVFAVYQAVTEALKKVKSGKGPVLLELITFRQGDHTTADDASRYRSEKEVKEWLKKDPILRLKKYMEKKNLLKKGEEDEIKEEAEEKVKKAVESFEAIEKPKIEDMFNFMYEEMPWNLKEQLEDARENA